MILKRWPVSIPLSAICPPMVIVGYGHCCADNQKLTIWPLSMSNAYTASCVRMRCCLSVNLQYRPRNGRIQGKWPSGKVISGGALTASSSTVIMAKNCVSRSHWTAAIARHCNGRPVPGDMTVKLCRTHAGCGGTTLRQQPAGFPRGVANRQRFSLPLSSDTPVRQNSRAGA